jgi:hypothetical protein
MGVAVFLLSACSKTVTWEEEVPLNTGEVIWVERSVDYSIQGDAGNPMDLAWRPKKEQTLNFEWKGKKYRYEGDACLQVLAIHQGLPVLIARSGCHGWAWTHQYEKCESYVQLNTVSPTEWIWLPRPANWVFGLRTNLVVDFTNRDRFTKPVTADLRTSYETKDPRGSFLTSVERASDELIKQCKERNK